MAGFTLLELIVAAGILALIAVFSWRGLDSLIREREAIAASQQTLDAYSRAFARIERDAMLSRDAELDESGVMRLVANPAAGGTAAVEYRAGQGSLVRRVAGQSAPITMIDGVGAVTMELWVPAGATPAAAPGGQRTPGTGGWVRFRQAPATPPPEQAPPNPAQGAQPATAGGNVQQAVAQAQAGTQQQNAAQAGRPGQPTLAPISNATGLRIAIARPDGTMLTRTFLIGSGG